MHLRGAPGSGGFQGVHVANAPLEVRQQFHWHCQTKFYNWNFRLRALAAERRRFGYRRLFVLLRREGEPSCRNRIYRPYRE